MKRVLSFWCKLSLLALIFSVLYFFVNDPWRKDYQQATILAIDYNSIPYKVINEDSLNTFYGQLTAYAPTCKGCSGITKSGYDVRHGNIYYYDLEYGKVRIVAADPKIPLGTIVKITSNYFDYPFLAIVLDRGQAIKGDIFDLLFENDERLSEDIGRLKNVKYEILRYSW